MELIENYLSKIERELQKVKAERSIYFEYRSDFLEEYEEFVKAHNYDNNSITAQSEFLSKKEEIKNIVDSLVGIEYISIEPMDDNYFNSLYLKQKLSKKFFFIPLLFNIFVIEFTFYLFIENIDPISLIILVGIFSPVIFALYFLYDNVKHSRIHKKTSNISKIEFFIMGIIYLFVIWFSFVILFDYYIFPNFQNYAVNQGKLEFILVLVSKIIIVLWTSLLVYSSYIGIKLFLSKNDFIISYRESMKEKYSINLRKDFSLMLKVVIIYYAIITSIWFIYKIIMSSFNLGEASWFIDYLPDLVQDIYLNHITLTTIYGLIVYFLLLFGLLVPILLFFTSILNSNKKPLMNQYRLFFYYLLFIVLNIVQMIIINL